MPGDGGLVERQALRAPAAVDLPEVSLLNAVGDDVRGMVAGLLPGRAADAEGEQES